MGFGEICKKAPELKRLATLGRQVADQLRLLFKDEHDSDALKEARHDRL